MSAASSHTSKVLDASRGRLHLWLFGTLRQHHEHVEDSWCAFQPWQLRRVFPNSFQDSAGTVHQSFSLPSRSLLGAGVLPVLLLLGRVRTLMRFEAGCYGLKGQLAALHRAVGSSACSTYCWQNASETCLSHVIHLTESSGCCDLPLGCKIQFPLL